MSKVFAWSFTIATILFYAYVAIFHTADGKKAFSTKPMPIDFLKKPRDILRDGIDV